VYNFAVAEHHTYFAGDGGVWVHNVCPAELDELKLAHQGLVKQKTKAGKSLEDAWDEAINEVLEPYSLTAVNRRGQLSAAHTLPPDDGLQIAFHLFENVPEAKDPIATIARVREKLNLPPYSVAQAARTKTVGAARIAGDDALSFGAPKNWSRWADELRDEYSSLLDDLLGTAWRQPYAHNGRMVDGAAFLDHAEALSILRLHKRAGGNDSLAEKAIEIFTDRPTCQLCDGAGSDGISKGLRNVGEALGVSKMTFRAADGSSVVMAF